MIYPPLVWMLSRLFGKHGRPPIPDAASLPTASLLIVAHNEETLIRERLENALATDYPAGKLEIVIASDGSTDRTVGIVEEYSDRGIRCLACPSRRGKAAALREAREQLFGDVVV